MYLSGITSCVLILIGGHKKPPMIRILFTRSPTENHSGTTVGAVPDLQ